MKVFFSSLKLMQEKMGGRLFMSLGLLLLATALLGIGIAVNRNKTDQPLIKPDTTINNVIAASNPESAAAARQEYGQVLAANSSCQKLGINFAKPGPITEQALYTRAARLNMGYTLQIAYSPDEVRNLAPALAMSMDSGLIPIVRLCDAHRCDFGGNDGAEYARALHSLANMPEIKGRTIYAIAGPNEPLAEPWTGGSEGDPNSVGPGVAKFMNDTINNTNHTGIKLLSPAFNTTEPAFERLVQVMSDSGAQWNKLAGVAANAYNLNNYVVNGQPRPRISDFVRRINEISALSGKPLFLTEIGMYESERNPAPYAHKIPHSQAMNNLADEIDKLRDNSQVVTFLLFDSFGTNGGFPYNIMTDGEIRQVNGTECSDPGDITPIPGGSGSGSGPGSNSQCVPEAGYCSAGTELSFEDYDGGCRTDRDEVCDPTGGWNWFQDGADSAGKCGDYTQTPVDGNPQTVCRVPEIRGFSPAGGQQCTEMLTTAGDRSMKLFSAFASLNAGTCYDLGANWPGGRAGFDVRVKSEIDVPFGNVDVYLGYTTLGYKDVATGDSWTGVSWTVKQTVGPGDYGADRYKTVSVSIDIPAGSRSFCTRINSENAGVGISSFWDGGYIQKNIVGGGDTNICQTAMQTSDADGIPRTGGGQCACDDSGNPVPPGGPYDDVDPEKYDYDFSYAQSKGWNMPSCDFNTVSNGIESEFGQLYVGLDLNQCADNNNAGFTCGNSENWTAGFAWTSCLKEFPLLNYLAAKEGTQENNFITDCQLDSFRSFMLNGEVEDDGLLRFNFTNEFPGLALLQGDGGVNARMRVPRLGGAAACGFINWDDFQSPFHISPELVGIVTNTGGFNVTRRDDSLLAILFNFLKDTFSGPAIGEDISSSNERKLLTPACTDLEGGAITKVNVSDAGIFDFADDGGNCEQIIESENYELTSNQVCDTQFVYDREPRQTGPITGANCSLSNFNVNNFTFDWDDFKNGPAKLTDLGIMIETGPPVDPTPGTCPMWAVTCNNGASFIETSCDTQHLFEITYGVGNGYTAWQTEHCAGNWGIYNNLPTSGCRVTPQYSSTNLCGLPSNNCGLTISDLYGACRFDQGGEVTEITGDPYVRWERPEPWDNLYVKGLGRMVESAWWTEYTNVPYKVQHENVGIKIKACVSVYDLQHPKSSDGVERADITKLDDDQEGGSVYGASTIAQSTTTPAPVITYYLEDGKVLGADLDEDELIQTINSANLKYGQNSVSDYIHYDTDNIAEYNPQYGGGFDLANIQSSEASSPDGVSQVCFAFYYPYVGQIPRIHERLSYFLTNQKDNDPGEPFKDPFGSVAQSTDGGSVQGLFDWVGRLENQDLKTVLIGFGSCDGQSNPNCDHFITEDDEFYNESLETYLGSRGSPLAISVGANPPIVTPVPGGGNGGQCTPDGEPGGTVDKSQLVAPVDNVVVTQCYGNTKKVDGSNLNCLDHFDVGLSGINYGPEGGFGYFHMGIDMGIEQTVYAAGSGQVYNISRDPGGCGNSIILEHKTTDGQIFYTKYCHLANIAVTEGQNVTKDTELGLMGTTGNSTGIHLHFEVLSCPNYSIECVDDPTDVLLRPRNGIVRGIDTEHSAVNQMSAEELAYYDSHTALEYTPPKTNAAQQERIKQEIEGKVLGASTGQPTIITRAQWGANESIVTNVPVYTTPTRIHVHHTVGGYNTDPRSYLNSVLINHVSRLGGDIGYNYLIDKNGNIYEGRKGGPGVLGAHTRYNNPGSVGISIIGDYRNGYNELTQATKDSLNQLIAYLADLWDIDPKWGTTVVGHKDFYVNTPECQINNTACPGDQIYAYLGQKFPKGDGVLEINACDAGTTTPGPTTTGGTNPTGTITPEDDENSCPYNPPTTGSQKNLECLMIDVANFLNAQSPRVPWEFLWAIHYQETRQRCTVSHALWNSTFPNTETLGNIPGYGNIYRFTDSCGGNPNQTGMAKDANSAAYPQIRGTTQFSVNAFNKVSSVGYINLFNPTSGDLLDECLNYLGVDRSRGQERQIGDPGGQFNTVLPEKFSRARLGDSLCATAIMTSDLAAYFGNNGQYADPAEWFTNQVLVDKAAGGYHGLCVYQYPGHDEPTYYCQDVTKLMNFARDYFADINCEE